MTTPTLNLYGLPRPALRNPKLASTACWLFAAANFLEISLFAFYFATRHNPPTPITIRITIAGICFVPAVLAVGTLILFIADIAHRQISPWPLRGILLFVLIFASLLGFVGIRFFLLFANRPPTSDSVFLFLKTSLLPLQVTALASAVCAYACAFIYCLQLASLLCNKALHTASIFILGLAILSTCGQLMRNANILANLHESGITIPGIIHLALGYLQAGLAIALTIFFSIAAIRLRRIAYPRISPPNP